METARGASSAVSAARVVHTLSPMGQKEAKVYGVPEERAGFFIRLDDAKANFTAPTKRTVWFERSGVTLPNGEDTVGVLEHVRLTKAERVGVAGPELESAIVAEVRRLEEAGGVVSATAFAEAHGGLDGPFGLPRERLRLAVEDMVERGLLQKVRVRVEGGRRPLDCLRTCV